MDDANAQIIVRYDDGSALVYDVTDEQAEDISITLFLKRIQPTQNIEFLDLP